MEKMREIPQSPLDIFLLPVSIHKRITKRWSSLLLAFACVGFFDVFFIDNLFERGLLQGGALTATGRLFALVLLGLGLGALDVVCVMWPIGDFARLLANRRERYISSGIHIILMKSYALSHLLFLIPYGILLYSGINWHTPVEMWSQPIKLTYAILMAFIQILPFVQLGILYRTLSVRSKLDAFPKLLVCAAVYCWMQLCGQVLYSLESMAFQRIFPQIGG